MVPQASVFQHKLDFATGEIIEALRFARSESIRSGDVFGVTVNEATDRITVFKAKIAPLPVSPDYIVYHPVRKQLWDVRLAANPASSGVDVESTGGPFEYIGLAPQPTVLFNPRGRPFGVDITTGTRYRLDSQTKIKLNYQQSNKNISLDPINGRVTS